MKDANRQWFVIEVHGRWTDAEYEAMCESVADAAIDLGLDQPPEAGDPDITGHALAASPEWVGSETSIALSPKLAAYYQRGWWRGFACGAGSLMFGIAARVVLT